MNDPLGISVIIPTTDLWPAAETTYRSIRSQTSVFNAEIILASGSGEEVPDELQDDPQVNFISYAVKTTHSKIKIFSPLFRREGLGVSSYYSHSLSLI